MKTIKDLYEWAVKNNADNLILEVQYQDDGGAYIGDTYSDNMRIGIDATVEHCHGNDYVVIE